MEILVKMDEFDTAQWAEVQDFYRKAALGEVAPVEHKKRLAAFWYDMIEKYPVLKNYKLMVDTPSSTICKFGSYHEFGHRR